ILGQGVATIRASQAGNNVYNPASFVEKDLTITKVPQTIHFDPIPPLLLSEGTFILNSTGRHDANASSTLSLNFAIADTSIAEV